MPDFPKPDFSIETPESIPFGSIYFGGNAKLLPVRFALCLAKYLIASHGSSHFGRQGWILASTTDTVLNGETAVLCHPALIMFRFFGAL